MKKRMKLWLIVATGALCLGLALAGAACADKTATLPEPSQTEVQGIVHILESGIPEETLGTTNDICLVASTSQMYKKTNGGWKLASFETYSVEGNLLTVNYTDGTVGTYTVKQLLADAEGGEHVHTFGDRYDVYEAKCIIPGIAVRYCTECKESFVEITPANPDDVSAHAMVEYIYGGETIQRCEYCCRCLDADGTTLGNFLYEVKGEDSISEVFEDAENGSTVVLGESTTLDADERLEVEGNKSVTFDVNGNTVTNEMNDAAVASGDNKIVVGEGSTLTITDTAKTEDETPKGAFSLNVKSLCDNYDNGTDLQYGLKVEGGHLNFENVDFNLTNKTGDFAACVADGGTVTFGKNTNVKVDGKDSTEKVDQNGGFGGGFYVSNGASVVFDGGTMVASGDITPFTIGYGDKESTILVKAGSKFILENTYNTQGSIAAGILVYKNSHVIFEQNSDLIMQGSAKDPNVDNFTYTAGIFVVGGGTVDFGGNLTVNLTKNEGWGYAFQVATNYVVDETNLKTHIINNARVTIQKTAVLNAQSQAILIIAQRNGLQKIDWDTSARRISKYYDLELSGGDAQYSVVIEDGAKILRGEQVLKLSDSSMTIDQGSAADTQLDIYTKKAILDNRVFE